MNRLIIAVSIMIFLCVGMFAALASAASISWGVPETGSVDGYKLYYSDGTTEYQASFPSDQLSVSLDDLNLVPGIPYDFQIVAYNAAGESPRSNIVTTTLEGYDPGPDHKPIKIVIPSGTTLTIQAQ